MFGFSFTVIGGETKENLFKNRFVYLYFVSLLSGKTGIYFYSNINRAIDARFSLIFKSKPPVKGKEIAVDQPACISHVPFLQQFSFSRLFPDLQRKHIR